MSIITEEMRYRQRLCEYAIKNGVTKVASRYHTNRQFVCRQLKNMMELQEVYLLNPEDPIIVQMHIQLKNLT